LFARPYQGKTPAKIEMHINAVPGVLGRAPVARKKQLQKERERS
jgi:hypothetical protein